MPRAEKKKGAKLRPRSRTVDDFNKFRQYKRKRSVSTSGSHSSRHASKSKSGSSRHSMSGSKRARKRSRSAGSARDRPRRSTAAQRKSIRSRQKRRKASESNTQMWIWIIAGGGTVLLLAVGGFLWFRQRDPSLVDGDTNGREISIQRDGKVIFSTRVDEYNWGGEISRGMKSCWDCMASMCLAEWAVIGFTGLVGIYYFFDWVPWSQSGRDVPVSCMMPPNPSTAGCSYKWVPDKSTTCEGEWVKSQSCIKSEKATLKSESLLTAQRGLPAPKPEKPAEQRQKIDLIFTSEETQSVTEHQIDNEINTDLAENASGAASTAATPSGFRWPEEYSGDYPESAATVAGESHSVPESGTASNGEYSGDYVQEQTPQAEEQSGFFSSGFNFLTGNNSNSGSIGDITNRGNIRIKLSDANKTGVEHGSVGSTTCGRASETANGKTISTEWCGRNTANGAIECNPQQNDDCQKNGSSLGSTSGMGVGIQLHQQTQAALKKCREDPNCTVKTDTAGNPIGTETYHSYTGDFE